MVQARDVVSRAGDAKVKVCVIDSGYARAHEDLADGATASPDAGTGAFDVDRCGHGTHVAGTIAALENGIGVVGVAPDAVALHVVKVFGDDCRWTYSSSLVRAVYDCVEAGSRVINLSLGGGTPHWFEAMTFEWAYLRGVLPIAAAGNRGDTSVSYPAGYNAVVSVGAIDAEGRRASFSQQNQDVELVAPGVGVLSTVPSGYSAWSGTSMATPHVAGVAALVWSRNPSWTNEQVRSALQTTAFDLWPSGRDSATGFGLVQASRALQALESGCEAGNCGSSSGPGSGGGVVDCAAVCGCQAN
jgi:serine protease